MSGWHEKPKRKPNSKQRFGRKAALPGWSEQGSYFKGSVLQWTLVLAGFAVLVGSLTRAPQQDEIAPEDLEKPIPERDFKAAFDFQAVDQKATNDARDLAAAKVPDYYRVNQVRVQQQRTKLARLADQIAAHRDAVSEKVIEALRESTSDQQVETLARAAVNRYIAELPEEERKTLPAGSTLQTWLTPDMASLPVRVYEPLEDPAPEENGVAGEDTETEAAEPLETPEDKPRKVVALEGANGGEPALMFTKSQALRTLALDGLVHVLNQGVRPAGAISGEAARIVRSDATAALDRQGRASQVFLAEAPTPEEAETRLNEWLVDAAKAMAMDVGTPNDWAMYHEAALAAAQPLVQETLQFDKVYTDGARAKVWESVPPVMKTILANEIMQPANRPWSVQNRSDVNTYLSIVQSERDVSRQLLSSLFAHIILVALLLAALYRSVELFGGAPRHGICLEPQDARRHFNLALLMLCVTALVGRVMMPFEPSGFLLPVATVGVLFAILVNVRLATVVGMLAAVLVSAQFNYDWRVFTVMLAMSIAGVYGIQKVRRRSDMTAASLKAAAAGLLAVAAISLAVDSLLSEAALRRLALVALNGGICLALVPALLSPLERLFGITTDILLLEYSDLNNPVLNRMAIEVPATFSHSLMLGQLAEAAADAIGANGLMARVCAYYHDIGKMRRPEYFCENQTDENIHDRITPRMSARAIAAHVLYGAEMARAQHLPQPIIDGILEHHGTCQIGYFYQQAKKEDKHGDAREEEFRYPGPKPQRPETAILMICDAVESGIRSIKNLNEERTRDFVDKIVASRLEDRQFDDCNLTLKELNVIAEVVTQRILATMHKRIAYPNDKKEQEEAANIIPIAGGGA